MELSNEAELQCQNSYGDHVEAVLAKLHLKVDTLDEPHFDVVAYINETQQNIDELDNKIVDLLQKRWQIEDNGPEIIEGAMKLIKTLVLKIEDVQDRATKSEKMVRDITQDIQQLDQAKRNLTVSITVLNNLILIVNVLDRLNSLLGIRNYDEKIHVKTNQGLNDSLRNTFSETNFNKTEYRLRVCALSQPILKEVLTLLSQAQRLIQPMFSAYGVVPSVAGLSAELDKIHLNLAEGLVQQLKLLLTTTRSINDNANIIKLQCNLIDLLPQSTIVKSDLLTWFISRHLAEYKELFEPNQTTAWLDKIDHRFNWLKINFNPLEHLLDPAFPLDWLVNEHFIIEFCRLTYCALKVVMKRRQSELTHNLIIFALQRTLTFESNLNKNYTGNLLKPVDLKKIDQKHDQYISNPFDKEDLDENCVDQVEINNVEHEIFNGQPFDGIISSVFEPYFDLYLVHVEKGLRDQLSNRLVGDFTVNKSSFENYNLGDVFKDDNVIESHHKISTSSDPGANTLNSATDLFLLFKQIIKQTLQLNRGQGFLGLVRLLRQYMSEYTVRVLLSQIPGLSVGPMSGGTNAAPDVAAKMAAFGLNSLSVLGLGRTHTNLSTAFENMKPQNKFLNGNDTYINISTNQMLSHLLRDDIQTVRLKKEEVYKVCVILVTAVFCLKTVEDLEKRLKLEIRPHKWSSKISFVLELDGLIVCRSVCVHRLVSDLEAAIEPQLVCMTQLPWSNLTQVGDQSAYVTSIMNHLKIEIPLIRDTLYTVRPTFTQICIKFADALINRFINSLYRCKPVNTFGAEQLLLDTQSLKAALLQMPLLGSKVNQISPRSFMNLVHEGMGRAERIIKTVMLPVGNASQNTQESTLNSNIVGGFVMGQVDENSATAFLTSYKQLIFDSTQTDLQKVLQMKGIKYNEQQLILDMFNAQNQLNSISKVTTELKVTDSVSTIQAKTFTSRS